MLRQGDHHSALADDANLLARNLGDRVAQILLMVERDVSYDREERLDDIGRVQAAAHPNFQHCNLDAHAGEVLKRHHRQHLEEAGMPGKPSLAQKVLSGLLDAVVYRAKLGIRNLFPVYANTLVDPHQMRRAVKPGLVAGRAQDRGECRGGGSFAVGAGDQHAGKAAFRIAQRQQHLANVAQIELVRRRRGQLVPERVKLFNRACVRHRTYCQITTRKPRRSRSAAALPMGIPASPVQRLETSCARFYVRC